MIIGHASDERFYGKTSTWASVELLMDALVTGRQTPIASVYLSADFSSDVLHLTGHR